MSQYILYVKQDCGLCEEFIHELGNQLPNRIADFKIIDISGKPDLIAQYGEKIPVVTHDGETICQYFFDLEVFN